MDVSNEKLYLMLNTINNKNLKILLFECYGSYIKINTNLEDLQIIISCLPPQSRFVNDDLVDQEFTLLVHKKSTHCYYSLYHGKNYLIETQNITTVLTRLESEWHLAIAFHASPFLFVHAGVVGWQGKAIIIPGRSMSGKTSLIAALIKAGAEYYSDEYAVFDESGHVHPYLKPLSIRDSSGSNTRKYSATDLGGQNGGNPLPVGLIAICSYHKDVVWNPITVTPGKTILHLLDNTICARTRTDDAIKIFTHATEKSIAIASERPDCKHVVPSLLTFCEQEARKYFFKHSNTNATISHKTT